MIKFKNGHLLFTPSGHLGRPIRTKKNRRSLPYGYHGKHGRRDCRSREYAFSQVIAPGPHLAFPD